MGKQDTELYKELVAFCNANKGAIESKFERDVSYTEFNENCFVEMYENIRAEPNPVAPKVLKERVSGLTECYKFEIPKYLKRRNEYIKGFDIQLGQWYEKAFKMFLNSKGIDARKRGFPFPDYIVGPDDKPIAYYELKFIESPFVLAHTTVKNTFPYKGRRYDYECSLTLDTGDKLATQRAKIENDILPKDIPTFYVWWFDPPHLKGIFYMLAQEVFEFYDVVGTTHERDTREGDKKAKQETGKIYPPLLKMKSISDLLKQFKV